jgi:WD40 repeat protein
MEFEVKYSLVQSGTVTVVKFSPDGKYLLTADTEATIYLWKSFTGQHIKSFTGHERGISDLSWSFDSTTFKLCTKLSIVLSFIQPSNCHMENGYYSSLYLVLH